MSGSPAELVADAVSENRAQRDKYHQVSDVEDPPRGEEAAEEH
ncbi:MAG: hypothetical protein ACE5HQ_13165 [Gemmatimonadota bacterium]